MRQHAVHYDNVTGRRHYRMKLRHRHAPKSLEERERLAHGAGWVRKRAGIIAEPFRNELIAAINEQLWVGHFDIWTHTGMIMYRQALVLPGGLTASTAQCESMLVGAIHACERYFPAFQFVVWAGKNAAEAMSAAMFDTQGEA